jgi:hypothetical protein
MAEYRYVTALLSADLTPLLAIVCINNGSVVQSCANNDSEFTADGPTPYWQINLGIKFSLMCDAEKFDREFAQGCHKKCAIEIVPYSYVWLGETGTPDPLD